MTRRELQETTGLASEALMDALKVLCGPEYDDDRARAVRGWRRRKDHARAGMAGTTAESASRRDSRENRRHPSQGL